MADLKLSDIQSKMRKLDICMMATTAKGGGIYSRPMSNNADVEYDGNSYFFSLEESDVVKELKEDPNVNLAFQGHDKLFISVSGKADLITDPNTLEEHWIDELNKWFEEGLNTPGIILIHVKAAKIHYWQREKEGEVKF